MKKCEVKKNIRIIGIDDSPFKFEDEETSIVGVVTRAPNYIEGIIISKVEVDGLDSTERITEMIQTSRYRPLLKAILIDGACLGGFNVVDIKNLYKKLEIPIITVSRDRPDFGAIELALRKYLKDTFDIRMKLLKENENKEITNKYNHEIYVRVEGMEIEEAEEIINLFTVRGALPESIRIAHMIGSAMVQGESNTRA